ncbi:uncharacterized protein APUU_40921A [Aspergillus puulaauensis]|uniref:Uncharacterized protein n=1 Tax=Aspergillus puulaauensis TaxID=1220207 RepID=A0A7R8AN36_9EURO|nr:uncharacterized protein APUU_40921A [Aspergillus puulaauensis]BCS24477.1 hypothetical protein APUU_40921A [Aspergillus puulaauensis]
MGHKRSTSMPISRSYTLHVHEIDLQNASVSKSAEGPGDAIFETKAGVKRLFHSLRARHIDVSSMAFERFKQTLRRAQTQTERQLLKRFLLQPMQISNAELKQILEIRNVFEGDKVPAMTNVDRAHRFYIRSWVFTPVQLLLVVQLLRTKGFGSARLDEWEFQCCITVFGTLTVRYIGMIKGRRDFVQRSQLDISEKSPNSLFGAFRDIMKERFPLVHDELEIHEFPHLAFSMLGSNEIVGNQLVADDTERLLIQFFGERSLLNVQSGGQYIDYLPKITDEKLFRGFNSRYFTEFSSSCEQFPGTAWGKLSDDFDEIERHARTHSELYHFHHDYFNVMKNEARPYQYKGYTVMVYLGEELSRKHLKAGHTFFQGSASVSVFVRGLINRLSKIEREKFNSGNQPPDLQKTYTFFNVLPLPDFPNVHRALQILKNYIQCTQPIIIVTYGHRSHAAIASGFQKLKTQRCGLPPMDGTLIRISNRMDGVVGKGQDIVHISLSHPGKYQYGNRDPASLRNFYIQKQLVYLVAHCTMDAIDHHLSTPSLSSRRDLTAKVLNHVCVILKGLGTFALKTTDHGIDVSLPENEPSQKGCGSKFIRNSFSTVLQMVIKQRVGVINQNLEEDTTVVPNSGRSSSKRKADAFEKDLTCPIFGYGTFDCIFSFGRAHGSQNSPERISQLEKLWAENIPELHLAIPNNEEMHERWVKELSSLTQGQSYFLKVVDGLPQSEYLKALALVCKSTGRHKRRYDGIGEKTQMRSGLWVSRKDIQARRVELSPRVKTKDLQGFPVEIKPNSEIKIKWLTSGGQEQTLTVESPRCAMPQNGTQTRALSFTEHGIDIVDASGFALRPCEPWEKEPSKATLPRWGFKSKNGQLLQELWGAVRSELGLSIPPDRIRGLPPRINGVGLVPSNSATETPQQNKPPRVQDANFLLYNFLNERFPSGGVFRTISRAKDKNSTEDLQEFVKFCRRPQNVNHPYCAKWLDMLDRPRPFIAILAPNIRAYRSCQTQKTYPYMPGSGCHLTETVFHVGPRGKR